MAAPNTPKPATKRQASSVMRRTDCRRPAFCSRCQSRNTSSRTHLYVAGSELHPCRILFHPPLPRMVLCGICGPAPSSIPAFSRLAPRSFLLLLPESTAVPRAPGIPLSGPARTARIRDVPARNTVCRSGWGTGIFTACRRRIHHPALALLTNFLTRCLPSFGSGLSYPRCCFGLVETDPRTFIFTPQITRVTCIHSPS